MFLSEKITLSTIITASRIILVPFIITAMVAQQWGVTLLLFTVAALTDIIDGTLARYMGQVTNLGAHLDPVADKILLLSCYGALAFITSPLFKIPVWFLSIIFLKELALVAGGLYLVFIKQHIIRPTLFSKLTTLYQVIFLWILLASAFFNFLPETVFYYILLVLITLSVITLMQYAAIAYRTLNYGNKK